MTAFKVTRVGQLVAGEASQRLGIPFGIVDLSLAPTPAIRRQRCGKFWKKSAWKESGHREQRHALAMLNDQVQKRRSYGIFLCRRFERRIYSG